MLSCGSATLEMQSLVRTFPVSGSQRRSETRQAPPVEPPRGALLFQGVASVFATVPAGQNLRPRILNGCGRMPASVHRSMVRMETWCRSAMVRVRSSSVNGHSAAGSGFLRDMGDWLRDLVAIVAKDRTGSLVLR